MASIFRSISFKIFGISVGLLLIMVVAAFGSAVASEQVHRQLRTLEQVMFPLARTMANVELEVQKQKVTADFLLEAPDDEAVTTCLGLAKKQGAKSRDLLQQAKRLIHDGLASVQSEQNLIALARFSPMVDELAHQDMRLAALTVRACARDATAGEMEAAKAQADDIMRLSDQIAVEITSFVEGSSRNARENQELAARANTGMIGSATLVGLMLAWVVSRGLTRPILRLQAGARAVSAGLLAEAHVPVTTRDEIGDVTHAFNTMLVDLQEKEKIKDTFGQYVDPRIVADLLNGGQTSSGGKKQVATIFFSDIVGFSGIAERLAPGTLVHLMNAYFSAMSDPIQRNSGIVDKYIGDAIMAFWVPPFADIERQAELACRAALEQTENLAAFHKQIPDIIGLRRDVPLIDFRLGIVTGEVVVGSVGSKIARSFTAMGDCVNQASRLEAVNKIYGTRVLIDHATRSAAGDVIEAREVDLIVVPGSSAPLRIYELAALKGGLAAARQELFSCYEEGLHWYRAARWDQAAVAFSAALNIDPQDKPSRVMFERTTNAQAAQPANWDGVWVMTAKL